MSLHLARHACCPIRGRSLPCVQLWHPVYDRYNRLPPSGGRSKHITINIFVNIFDYTGRGWRSISVDKWQANKSQVSKFSSTIVSSRWLVLRWKNLEEEFIRTIVALKTFRLWKKKKKEKVNLENTNCSLKWTRDNSPEIISRVRVTS